MVVGLVQEPKAKAAVEEAREACVPLPLAIDPHDLSLCNALETLLLRSQGQ
jgi:hypothetical protein